MAVDLAAHAAGLAARLACEGGPPCGLPRGLTPSGRACTGEYFERKPTPKSLSARELDPQLQERAWRLGSDLVAGAPTNIP